MKVKLQRFNKLYNSTNNIKKQDPSGRSITGYDQLKTKNKLTDYEISLSRKAETERAIKNSKIKNSKNRSNGNENVGCIGGVSITLNDYNLMKLRQYNELKNKDPRIKKPNKYKTNNFNQQKTNKNKNNKISNYSIVHGIEEPNKKPKKLSGRKLGGKKPNSNRYVSKENKDSSKNLNNKKIYKKQSKSKNKHVNICDEKEIIKDDETIVLDLLSKLTKFSNKNSKNRKSKKINCNRESKNDYKSTERWDICVTDMVKALDGIRTMVGHSSNSVMKLIFKEAKDIIRSRDSKDSNRRQCSKKTEIKYQENDIALDTNHIEPVLSNEIQLKDEEYPPKEENCTILIDTTKIDLKVTSCLIANEKDLEFFNEHIFRYYMCFQLCLSICNDMGDIIGKNIKYNDIMYRLLHCNDVTKSIKDYIIYEYGLKGSNLGWIDLIEGIKLIEGAGYTIDVSIEQCNLIINSKYFQSQIIIYEELFNHSLNNLNKNHLCPDKKLMYTPIMLHMCKSIRCLLENWFEHNRIATGMKLRIKSVKCDCELYADALDPMVKGKVISTAFSFEKFIYRGVLEKYHLVDLFEKSKNILCISINPPFESVIVEEAKSIFDSILDVTDKNKKILSVFPVWTVEEESFYGVLPGSYKFTDHNSKNRFIKCYKGITNL